MRIGSCTRFIFLLLAVLFFLPPVAKGAGVPLLENRGVYPVRDISYYMDNSRQMNITAVLQHAGHFRRVPSTLLSLHTTAAAVWVKISIDNRTTDTSWYLQLASPPVMQEVTLYELTQQPPRRIFHLSENSKTLNQTIIPLRPAAGATTDYYLRVRGDNMVRLSMVVADIQTLYERNHRQDVLNGIVLGVLGAFMVYNIFIFLLLKEPAYFFYVGGVFCWGLNLAFYNGYLPLIVQTPGWMNSASVLIPVSTFFSIWFTNAFLQTKIYAYRFYQLGWWLTGILAIPLALGVLGYWAAGFTVIQWIMYPFFFYWIGAGVVSYRRGFIPAGYHLAGFGAFVLGNTINNLKDLDILPDVFLTRTSMHWGAIAEAFILSLALAQKFNYYKQKEEKIRRAALKLAITFSHDLIQAQEKERKRIAAELHDSLGQKLILIKHKLLLARKQGIDLPEDQFSGNVGAIIQEVRNISYSLRPYQIDLMGITQALQSLAEEQAAAAGISCHLSVDPIDGLFSPDNEINIYRIVQTLLQQALPAVPMVNDFSLILRKTNEEVHLFFTPDPYVPMGDDTLLRDIRERVSILQGRFLVHASGYDMSLPVVPWRP